MLLDAAFLTVDGQRRVAASCRDWRGGCRRGGGLWRGRRVAGQLDGRHDVVCRFGRRRAFAVGDGDAARDVGFFAFVDDGAAGFAVRGQGESEEGEGEEGCGDVVRRAGKWCVRARRVVWGRLWFREFSRHRWYAG